MRCILTTEDYPMTCRPYGCFTGCEHNMRPDEALRDSEVKPE